MARSSFQGRTWGIPGSIPRGNNAWPVRMPLRMSRNSLPQLVGRKPVRKQKKKKTKASFYKKKKKKPKLLHSGARVLAYRNENS